MLKSIVFRVVVYVATAFLGLFARIALWYMGREHQIEAARHLFEDGVIDRDAFERVEVGELTVLDAIKASNSDPREVLTYMASK